METLHHPKFSMRFVKIGTKALVPQTRLLRGLLGHVGMLGIKKCFKCVNILTYVPWNTLNFVLIHSHFGAEITVSCWLTDVAAPSNSPGRMQISIVHMLKHVSGKKDFLVSRFESGSF